MSDDKNIQYIMLKIRLTQTGTKNQKKYRVIAIEEGKKRDGKALEILGYYNPRVKPAEISLDTKRIEYWISKGAQLSVGAAKLVKDGATA